MSTIYKKRHKNKNSRFYELNIGTLVFCQDSQQVNTHKQILVRVSRISKPPLYEV